MSADADLILSRLRPLPLRLRIAHLSALLRHEADGSPRAGELMRLLLLQSAAAMRGSRGG